MTSESSGGASLARRIVDAFYAVTLDDLAPSTLEHVQTLLLDAIACIYAAPAGLAEEAKAIAGAIGRASEPSAHILSTGELVPPAVAAMVNGALLRSRDLMDVYAGADVCHPSEAIPAILAAAEHAGASGRALLEATAAAVSLHVHLSEALPMHRNGFHHTGHASIVAPVAVGRLLGLEPDEAAAALNLASSGLLVPEGFSRGHVTNLKTYAYGLQAKNAFGAIAMFRAGLRGADSMLDEMIATWRSAGGEETGLPALTGGLDSSVVANVWLKQFPAQYALQPLISEALKLHPRVSNVIREIDSVVIRASQRTVERCADPAKYTPSGPEAADHSLPFCFAAALVDGVFDTATFERRRWRDNDVARIMALVRAEPIDAEPGYYVGRQEVSLRFADGRALDVVPSYPPESIGWRRIAMEKLMRLDEDRLDGRLIVRTIDELREDSSVRAAIEQIVQK